MHFIICLSVFTEDAADHEKTNISSSFAFVTKRDSHALTVKKKSQVSKVFFFLGEQAPWSVPLGFAFVLICSNN